jgi:hypothetical protein
MVRNTTSPPPLPPPSPPSPSSSVAAARRAAEAALAAPDDEAERLGEYRDLLTKLGDAAALRAAGGRLWTASVRAEKKKNAVLVQVRAPKYETQPAAAAAAVDAVRAAALRSSVLEHRALSTGGEADARAFLASLRELDAALARLWRVRAAGALLQQERYSEASSSAPSSSPALEGDKGARAEDSSADSSVPSAWLLRTDPIAQPLAAAAVRVVERAVTRNEAVGRRFAATARRKKREAKK